MNINCNDLTKTKNLSINELSTISKLTQNWKTVTRYFYLCNINLILIDALCTIEVAQNSSLKYYINFFAISCDQKKEDITNSIFFEYPNNTKFYNIYICIYIYVYICIYIIYMCIIQPTGSL